MAYIATQIYGVYMYNYVFIYFMASLNAFRKDGNEQYIKC